MPEMTAEEAVEVARAHGLSLTDALSLQRLAASPEEAAKLAKQFTAPAQLGKDDLKHMSAQDIVAAKEAGRLDNLLGIGAQPEPSAQPAASDIPSRPREGLRSGSVSANDQSSQLSRNQLKNMKPDEILAAKEQGRLNQLLGIERE